MASTTSSTLPQVLEDYLGQLQVREQTRRTYRSALRNYNDFLARRGMTPETATAQTVGEWREGMAADGTAASTARKRESIVRGFYSWAGQAGACTDVTGEAEVEATEKERELVEGALEAARERHLEEEGSWAPTAPTLTYSTAKLDHDTTIRRGRASATVLEGPVYFSTTDGLLFAATEGMDEDEEQALMVKSARQMKELLEAMIPLLERAQGTGGSVRYAITEEAGSPGLMSIDLDGEIYDMTIPEPPVMVGGRQAVLNDLVSALAEEDAREAGDAALAYAISHRRGPRPRSNAAKPRRTIVTTGLTVRRMFGIPDSEHPDGDPVMLETREDFERSIQPGPATEVGKPAATPVAPWIETATQVAPARRDWRRDARFIRTGGRGEGAKVGSYVRLVYDGEDRGAIVEGHLTQDHKLVSDAVASLWAEWSTHPHDDKEELLFSFADILRALGIKRPSADQVAAVRSLAEDLRQTFALMDWTGEMRGNAREGSAYLREVHLLNAERIYRFDLRTGENELWGYSMAKEPVILRQAEDTKTLTSFSSNLLESGSGDSSQTERYVKIRFYLITQMKLIENKNNKVRNNRVLFETICRNGLDIQEPDRFQLAAVREDAIDCLNDLKQTMTKWRGDREIPFFRDFTVEEDGVTIIF